MRRLRPLVSLSLLLTLQACAPAATAPNPAAPPTAPSPTPVPVPAADRPATVPEPRAHLAGRADMFGEPFASASVRLLQLADDKEVATATSNARGEFTFSLPTDLPAGELYKAIATTGEATLVTLVALPEPLALLAEDPPVLLDVSRTVAFGLLEKRLRAAGIMQHKGETASSTVEAFLNLTRALREATHEDSPALRGMLEADENGHFTLDEDGTNALDHVLTSEQEHAVYVAAHELASALRDVLVGEDADLVPEDLLTGDSAGGIYLGPVVGSSGGSSGGGGGDDTPSLVDQPIGLVVQDGAYLSPTASPAVKVDYFHLLSADGVTPPWL